MHKYLKSFYLPYATRLVFVTYKNNILLDSYLSLVIECAKSGITSVQLREKNASYSELLDFGKALKTVLNPFSIPLIINDCTELACELDAQGVHLGQSDGSVLEARKKLGKNKIIGLSVETLDQVLLANDLPVDYIGVGAIFQATSKKDVTTFWGVHGLNAAAQLSKHPIVAIGGVNENNAETVIKAGAHGIAAIGAFHRTPDATITTKNLRAIVGRGLYVK